MPLDTPVGASYVCLTCGTTYRHLIGGWTLAGPIVDLAPELQAPDPIDVQHPEAGSTPPPTTEMTTGLVRSCLPYAGFHRYEDTLDTDERTGN